MIILGIYPGVNFTGLGIVEFNRESGKYISVDWSVIHSNGNTLTEKIKSVYNGVENVLRNKEIDVAAVESIFYGKNIRTLIHLGELRGAILLLLAMRDIPIIEYSPREIKMALTGSGRSSKDQVGYMVKHILGIEEKIPKDASDALAIAICYIQREYG